MEAPPQVSATRERILHTLSSGVLSDLQDFSPMNPFTLEKSDQGEEIEMWTLAYADKEFKVAFITYDRMADAVGDCIDDDVGCIGADYLVDCLEDGAMKVTGTKTMVCERVINPEDTECSVCFGEIDPHPDIVCGHRFCQRCTEVLVSTTKKCPICRAEMFFDKEVVETGEPYTREDIGEMIDNDDERLADIVDCHKIFDMFIASILECDDGRLISTVIGFDSGTKDNSPEGQLEDGSESRFIFVRRDL